LRHERICSRGTAYLKAYILEVIFQHVNRVCPKTWTVEFHLVS
jgi:hypothetical protein